MFLYEPRVRDFIFPNSRCKRREVQEPEKNFSEKDQLSARVSYINFYNEYNKNVFLQKFTDLRRFKRNEWKLQQNFRGKEVFAAFFDQKSYFLKICAGNSFLRTDFKIVFLAVKRRK